MPSKSKYEVNQEPLAGYRLVSFLGAGQFGEVWRAVELSSAKPVALKIIDLSHSNSALKELKAVNLVKNLNHPHLIPIYTARLKDKHNRESPLNNADELRKKSNLRELVIAMGLGDKSLAARLKEINPDGTDPAKFRGLPVDELFGYMQGAAKGIDFLNKADHGLGEGDGPIVHCDIKPGNLMIVAGEIQVADCGVAVIIKPDARQTKAAGSPAYSPPELTANNPVPGTDQYALAISYYELRTGCLPFDEQIGQLSIMLAHAEGRLDFTHAVLTEEEVRVLKWATAIRPKERYASCLDMVKQLERAIEGLLPLEPSQIGIRSGVPSPKSEPSPPLVPSILDPSQPPWAKEARLAEINYRAAKPPTEENRSLPTASMSAMDRSSAASFWMRLISLFRFSSRRKSKSPISEPYSGRKPRDDLRWTVISGSPTLPKNGGAPVHQVFVSYRRDDSGDITGRIVDRLKMKFDRQVAFRDIDTIPLGYDFQTVINWALQRCQVMIVVIGPNWLTQTDEAGRIRIQDPEDTLRMEVEIGLSRGIPVIPVVVNRAPMPRGDQLPEPLRNLARRNGIAVRRDPDFDHDMERLIRGLQGFIAEEYE